MPRVCITTLGCKVNQVDSAYLVGMFVQQGFEVVDWPGPAEVCVVNTCTVTATADRQSRQMVNRARRANPTGLVVVTGCGPISGGGGADAFSAADLITGNLEKEELVHLIGKHVPGEKRRYVSSPRGSNIVQAGGAYEQHQRTRVFLKVQDGCPAQCAYCIVPTVRGPSRSVAVEQIIEAVTRLVAEGRQEIVLTGIHLGAFGRDLQPPMDLTDLCQRILKEAPLQRLRLSSIEPNEVTNRLIAMMAETDRLCPHLHIPLQSGSDRVLREMNRPYDVAFFEDRVRRCREALPHATLGADVLVGFPGEDEESFRETLDTLERLCLPHVHVFPYSDRPGTPAAERKDKVPPETIRLRAQKVRAKALDHRRAWLEGAVGSSMRVLIERFGEGPAHGLSRNYLPVRVEGAVESGVEVNVQITGFDERRLELLGRPA
jgi:threonylcarbamoyladenosine tRNA methylthiotransferase MtaB